MRPPVAIALVLTLLAEPALALPRGAGMMPAAPGLAPIPGRAQTSLRLTQPGDVDWDSRTWEVRASGLPATAVADRPDWGERQVVLDGKVLWVVAILPASVQTWTDRVNQGTRQAETTLHAFADYLVRARTAEDPEDYRERQLTSVRFRLKAGVDREGFVKVETAERPRAVWMRFGYPAEKLEEALGFQVPGAVDMAFPARAPKPRRQTIAQAERPREAGDYIWEFGWLGGVALVTVFAVLFAAATQK